MDPGAESLALFQQVATMVKSVYFTLGKGYTENVYQKALAVELQMSGIRHDLEVTMGIPYKGQTVGFVRADIILRGEVPMVIETKATAGALKLEEQWQVTKYMKLLGIPLGMLVNFSQSSQDAKPLIQYYFKNEEDGEMYNYVPDPKNIS